MSNRRSSARTEQSGCAFATGKIGGSTGPAAIETSCASRETSCSAKSSRSPARPHADRRGQGGMARASRRHGPARLARRARADRARPERASPVLAQSTNERQRTHELWGRIAAKEAARRLWLAAEARPSTRPTSPSCPTGKAGPQLFSLADPAGPAAAVSIAHSDGSRRRHRRTRSRRASGNRRRGDRRRPAGV